MWADLYEGLKVNYIETKPDCHKCQKSVRSNIIFLFPLLAITTTNEFEVKCFEQLLCLPLFFGRFSSLKL